MERYVVYESMYGNTAAIGEAIAASLHARGLDVEVGAVSRIEAAETAEFDLLVVGGPTHVHGMTTSATRKTAVSDEKNTFSEPTIEPGLRDWLKQLPSGEGRSAAAFDTRIGKPLILTGSAAKGIGHRLKGRGFRLVSGPGCFLVETGNRLLEGELAHATTWASEVAEQAVERWALSGHQEARKTVSSI